MSRPASRSAWRQRRFRVFASGNALNNVGEGMYALALPLLAFQVTGSLQTMALLAATYPLVLTLGGPLLGAVVDRFGPRWLVLPGLTLQFAAALALNLLLLSGPPPLWALFAAEVLVQTGAVAYRAGWMAGLPSMFDDVARARGALSTSYQATVVLGPALAAVLVGPLGIRGLLWLNLLTFLAPVVVWARGVRPKAIGAATSAGRWSLARDLREGWATLRASRQAYVLMLVLVPMNLTFGNGTVSLVLFYLRDDLGLSPGRTGAVLAVANVGALAGSAYVAERPRRDVGLVCVAGLLGSALCLFIVPLAQTVAVIIAALVLLYLLNSALEVAADMVLFSTVPPESLGRSVGFYRLVLGVPSVLGPLLIAALAEQAGARGAFLALGAVAAAPGLWLLLNRRHLLPPAAPDDVAAAVGPAVPAPPGAVAGEPGAHP